MQEIIYVMLAVVAIFVIGFGISYFTTPDVEE